MKIVPVTSESGEFKEFDDFVAAQVERAYVSHRQSGAYNELAVSYNALAVGEYLRIYEEKTNKHNYIKIFSNRGVEVDIDYKIFRVSRDAEGNLLAPDDRSTALKKLSSKVMRVI